MARVLVGRSELDRGVAHKITVVLPLKLQDRQLLLAGGAGGGGNAYTASETPPLNPNAGDLWYDLSTGTLSIRVADATSSQWIRVVPGGGSSGSTAPAGIEEAPSDGIARGRLNATWTPVLMITGDILDGGNF